MIAEIGEPDIVPIAMCYGRRSGEELNSSVRRAT